uniref:Kinesin motor domain-containing protein n=1 Tax=Chromera velia CCMP2878 TaxID=1169474 RepID=A0A0G4HEB8_9ALVE|eukprot:Cvel_6468.t1-p1 / transcript=Cvel_6468.t1 / gene=Cvel_6468 / organism=Chromera_velia_CCMP2878 / gene_product=Kinesin-related protein 4, putative / transcript_product=Kinesin-related protein 4, putative / location=Cvel_scaffold317:32076-51810(+) / protein_length=1723 / sequence_SO=supercontig / SO=protein_coding / is_pseudo=false
MERERNIRVTVRFRPLNGYEREADSKQHSFCRDSNQPIWKVQCPNTVVNQHLQEEMCFDRVFGEDASQVEVFDSLAKDVVHACAQGYNGTVFAYGQTSSGKTFTMTGSPAQPGVISLSVEELFRITREVGWVYNEQLIDLLEDPGKRGEGAVKALRFVTTPEGDIDVKDLREVKVDATEEVVRMMVVAREKDREGEGEGGAASKDLKAVAGTAGGGAPEAAPQPQEGGSVGVRGAEREVQVGILNLVDLAGSEGVQKAQTDDDERKRWVCACSPAVMNYYETKSTLEFALRVKKIKNKVKRNTLWDVDNAQRLQAHKKLRDAQRQLSEKEGEIAQLREEVFSLSSQLQSRTLPSCWSLRPPHETALRTHSGPGVAATAASHCVVFGSSAEMAVQKQRDREADRRRRMTLGGGEAGAFSSSDNEEGEDDADAVQFSDRDRTPLGPRLCPSSADREGSVAGMGHKGKPPRRDEGRDDKENETIQLGTPQEAGTDKEKDPAALLLSSSSHKAREKTSIAESRPSWASGEVRLGEGKAGCTVSPAQVSLSGPSDIKDVKKEGTPGSLEKASAVGGGGNQLAPTRLKMKMKHPKSSGGADMDKLKDENLRLQTELLQANRKVAEAEQSVGAMYRDENAALQAKVSELTLEAAETEEQVKLLEAESVREKESRGAAERHTDTLKEELAELRDQGKRGLEVLRSQAQDLSILQRELQASREGREGDRQTYERELEAAREGREVDLQAMRGELEAARVGQQDAQGESNLLREKLEEAAQREKELDRLREEIEICRQREAFLAAEKVSLVRERADAFERASALDSELQGVVERLKNAQTEGVGLKDQLGALRDENERSHALLQREKERWREVFEERQEAERVLEETRDDLNSRLATLREECGTLKESLESERNQMQQTKKERDEALEELAALDRVRLETEARLESNLSRVSASLEETERELKRAVEEKKKAETAVDDLDEQLAKMEERAGRAEGELESARNRAGGLEAALAERDRHLVALRDGISDAELRADAATSRQKTAEAALEELRGEAGETESRAESLERALREAKKEVERCSRMAEQKSQEALRLSSELSRLSAEAATSEDQLRTVSATAAESREVERDLRDQLSGLEELLREKRLEAEELEVGWEEAETEGERRVASLQAAGLRALQDAEEGAARKERQVAEFGLQVRRLQAELERLQSEAAMREVERECLLEEVEALRERLAVAHREAEISKAEEDLEVIRQAMQVDSAAGELLKEREELEKEKQRLETSEQTEKAIRLVSLVESSLRCEAESVAEGVEAALQFLAVEEELGEALKDLDDQRVNLSVAQLESERLNEERRELAAFQRAVLEQRQRVTSLGCQTEETQKVDVSVGTELPCPSLRAAVGLSAGGTGGEGRQAGGSLGNLDILRLARCVMRLYGDAEAAQNAAAEREAALKAASEERAAQMREERDGARAAEAAAKRERDEETAKRQDLQGELAEAESRCTAMRRELSRLEKGGEGVGQGGEGNTHAGGLGLQEEAVRSLEQQLRQEKESAQRFHSQLRKAKDELFELQKHHNRGRAEAAHFETARDRLKRQVEDLQERLERKNEEAENSRKALAEVEKKRDELANRLMACEVTGVSVNAAGQVAPGSPDRCLQRKTQAAQPNSPPPFTPTAPASAAARARLRAGDGDSLCASPDPVGRGRASLSASGRGRASASAGRLSSSRLVDSSEEDPEACKLQ